MVTVALALLAGAATCGSCHPGIERTFPQTAHFLTSARATAGSIHGSFDPSRNLLRTKDPNVWFRMERQGETFVQSSFDHGKARSEKFDLVIGSGRRGQSYLYWKDKLLYQLPVSYSALKDGWTNSPGYPDGEVHFERVIPPRCLDCHTTRTAEGQFAAGVLCQSCHGATEHPAIRNPAKAGREDQIAICAGCHSGVEPNPKPDVHGNQVGLLRRSKCFQSSPEMTCSTCHNVHERQHDLTALSQRCQGCHEPRKCPRVAAKAAAGANCISCHMPEQDSRVITFNTAGSNIGQPYRTHTIGIYPEQSKPPATPASPAGRVQFSDVAAEAGLTFRHENGASPQKHMFETFGSGVGVIDFDNDGWPDLFFANGADLGHGKKSPGNVLYRNLGNGKFVDVTAKAGVAGNGMFATGVTVGDYDNDGWLDLLVTGVSGLQLFHNNGDGTFTDVTAKAGVAAGGWSSSAVWVDYDRDGYLDLFVGRYVSYDMKTAPYCGYQKPGYRMYCDPQQLDGSANLLFHNNRDGTFTDVSRRAGVANPAGKTLGVAIGDVDGDGWPDIFVANDGVRNFLYHNNHNGTFTDATYSAGVGFDPNGKPLAGMGAEIADYDGDGKLDIFLTAFSREYNTLYRNLGNLLFEDVTLAAKLASGFLTLGFGTKLFDYNNDGALDIYVTNGHVTDNVELYDPELSYRQSDLLYENIGGGKFKDVSAEIGPGFRLKHVGRGAAVIDFDNDGDLDIVVSDSGGRPLLLRNDGGNRNHWLAVLARGRESNRFGIGTKIWLTAGGKTQFREINPYGSYLSTSDMRLYFGLGNETRAAKIEIEWPSGKKQSITGVSVDRLMLIDEGNAAK